MIKELNKKIFLLIMVSLSIVVLGVIVLFAFLNYNNTINTASMIIDRFVYKEPRKNQNDRIEENKIKPEINIEGLYYILVENGTVIQNPDVEQDKTINEYAIKISKKNNQKGIIGKYIYKTRKIKENTVSITLMENENAIAHIKMIYLISALVSIASITIIYMIAKKVSKIIVKPVEETFEKQKQFISDASHELKTPLAVIEANADVLENECRHK